jgi:hypothetical protein
MAAKTNRENGFSATALTLIVVGVTVIGAIGWQIWWATKQSPMKSNSGTSQGTTANPTTSAAASNSAKKLVITGWNVELAPADGLAGLKVKSGSTQIAQADVRVFVTYDMQNLGPDCSGQAPDSRPLGAIIRSQTELPQPSTNSFIKSINGFFYYYSAPGQSCSPNHDTEVLQYKNVDKIKASLSTLKAST